MGRAITIASFLVLCSFAFVFYQLWIRKPASAAPLRGPAPLLETRGDGSVYEVTLEIERLEKRLVDEEKRSLKLQADLDATRKEREELQKTVEDLRGDLRRLSRQVNQRAPTPPEPAPTPPPANGPIGPIAPEGEGTVTPP